MPKGYADDLEGRTFGRLRVLQHAGRRWSNRDWLCVCDRALGGCGRELVLSGCQLTRTDRASRSCGCRRREEDARRKAAGDALRAELRRLLVAGLSQSGAARRLGVSRQRVGQLLRGE